MLSVSSINRFLFIVTSFFYVPPYSLLIFGLPWDRSRSINSRSYRSSSDPNLPLLDAVQDL